MSDVLPSPNLSGAAVIRSAAFEGFESLMTEHGACAKSVLRSKNIDPEALVERDIPVPYLAYLGCLSLAAQETGLPHFGLLLAERQTISMYGLLGSVLAESPDLAAAIDSFVKFQPVHAQGQVSSLLVSNDTAIWRYTNLDCDAEGVSEQEDRATVGCLKIIRHFTGPDWVPEYYSLQRPKPKSITPYFRALGCTVRFGAEHNECVFDARYLKAERKSADLALHSQLEARLREANASINAGWASAAERKIHQSLGDHNCSIQRVATQLTLTPRTLQRKLAAEGKSFRSMVESARQRIARRCLRDTEMEVSDLSEMLGYSDLPAFSHAFKRLNGIPPSEWRQTRRFPPTSPPSPS